jgi:hypothetical protein
MKRKLIFFVMILSLTGLFTMQSCNEDEKSPVYEYGSFTDPVLLAPADGGFLNVTGTTVDLKWESTDSDGDAQSWDVYFGDNSEPDLFKAGQTTQSVTVNVTPGTEYFWRVETVDAKGVITTSPTWSFEVVDPAAAMHMDLSWETNALSVIGMEVDPLAAANLRLRILKSDKTTAAVTAINTTGYETYAGFNSLVDGKYYIAVDLTSTIDAGDFNAPLDIDIDLAFSQRGVQELTYSFPAVMTNQFACSTYRVYLGYVTKTGTTYTFTKEVSKPVSVYSGVWYGVDKADVDYDSEVETYQGCSLQIKGLVNGWMTEFWGEVIVKGGSASITINPNTGVVTIPLQYYCTTKYNGAVQTAYNIVGSGTYDASGAYPKMTIQYTLIQGTDDWAQWMFDEGYMATNKFEAELTLDPAGLKKGASKSAFNLTIPFSKPVKH